MHRRAGTGLLNCDGGVAAESRDARAIAIPGIRAPPSRTIAPSFPAKIYRALNDGSTQVALLSIDRSRAAWVRTITRGLAQRAEVEPFVSELGVLAAELERAFPDVRASTE
jgi:hypothetical protein